MKPLFRVPILCTYICLSVIVLPPPASSQSSDPPDTLANGGFEKWDAGMPVGWTAEIGAVEADVGAVSSFERIESAREGKYAIRLSGDAGTTHWSSFVQGPFTAHPGDKWRLSGWMRTNNVRLDGHRYENCQIFAIAFDEKEQRAGYWSSGAVSGTTDWSEREVLFQIPDNAVTFKIGVFFSVSGQADFDDLRMQHGWHKAGK